MVVNHSLSHNANNLSGTSGAAALPPVTNLGCLCEVFSLFEVSSIGLDVFTDKLAHFWLASLSNLCCINFSAIVEAFDNNSASPLVAYGLSLAKTLSIWAVQLAMLMQSSGCCLFFWFGLLIIINTYVLNSLLLMITTKWWHIHQCNSFTSVTLPTTTIPPAPLFLPVWLGTS